MNGYLLRLREIGRGTLEIGPKFLRRLSLAQRGSLFLLCSVVAILVVFTWMSANSVRRAEEGANRWITHSAGAMADHLDDLLRRGKEGIERLARWPGLAASLELLESGQIEAVPPWVTIQHLSSTLDLFDRLMFVTDRDGTVRWTKPLGFGLLGVNLSGMHPELNGAFAQRETYFSELHQDDLWPAPHVLAAVSIRDESGEVVGAIGGVIEAADLPIQLLAHEALEHGDEVEVYVVDGRGGIVTSTAAARRLQRVRGAEVAALHAHQHRGASLFQSDAEDQVFAMHSLSVVPWTVVIRQPAAVLHGEVSRVQRNLLATGALLAGLLFLVSIPFIKSIVDPIRGLTQDANRIASGDLSQPIPAEGWDETTALAVSLEWMRTRLAEDQRRLQAQVAELSEMNRLKNEFIANLSHEFRTPMHIMSGYLDLILDGSFGELSPRLREPLTSARKHYNGLWDLIESCLILATKDAGKVAMSAEEFDLCDVVREILAELELDAKAKGLRVSVQMPRAGCVVRTDRAKIRRVVRNLVHNAVKFTDAGEVEVRVEDVPGTETVLVRVRDTGIGIQDAHQDRLFERFTQGDGSATRRYSGAGLGLPICKELIELLGGAISATSTPGTGAVFSIAFPRVWRPEARDAT